jgi:TP901 family phage tail tape measure protein
LEDLSNYGQSAVQPLATVTDSILRFEAGLLLTATALGVLSIAAADTFDIAFREIATLTGQTSEALSGFRQDILDYASSSTQSLEQVTSAIYSAISGGVDYTRSLQIVTEAERLAVAGKAQLGTTLTGLISTLNAYGQSTDEAGRFSDIFFTTVRLGQTTLPELTASLSRVTSTAVAGGVSFETLGAAIATLTLAGAPTSEAVTRINSALSAIINPSKQARDLAEQLGIQFNAQALQSRGLESVLQDVARATGGNAEQMTRLFGSTEAFNAANVLAITGSDRFRSNLVAMQGASGATTAAFNTMKDATDTLAQAFTVAAVSLGTQFLGEFNAIEDALAELARAFTTAIDQDAFDPLIDVVEANMERIATLISSIAENLPAALANIDFGPFSDALASLFRTISELFNFDGLSTEEGLQRALQTLVDLLTRTTVYSEGALRSFGPFVEQLGEAVEWISNIDIDAIRSFGEIGGYALAASVAFGALGSVLGGIAGVAGALPRLATLAATIRTEFSLLSTVIVGGSTPAIIGVAGAVGVLAFELTRLTGLDEKLNDILVPDALSYQGATLGTLLADIAEKFGLMGRAVDESVPKLQTLPDAFLEQTTAARETRTEINGWLDAQEAAARQTADTSAEIARLTNYYRELGFAYDANTGALTRLNLVQNQASRDVYALAENIQRVGNSYEQIGGGTVSATGAFKAVSDSASEQAAKVDEATKKANDYLIKMEEIASNERIKTIEAVISLNIAGLEADTKRVEAAFKSIDNTITSTGDLLGSLFGTLIESKDFIEKSYIRDMIERELKMREEAFKLQQKLVEAQIEMMRARTSALYRGDALIKVDGTALKPHIEAIMWEIFSAIQIRANSTFNEFLLGLPTATA